MLSILTSLAVMFLPAAGGPKPKGPFAERGYYITFMRMWSDTANVLTDLAKRKGEE